MSPTQAQKAATWAKHAEKTNAKRREKQAAKCAAEGRPYKPRVPRGPSTSPHYIPEGHELGGVSRLTGADGETRAEWAKTRVAGADPVPLPEGFDLPSKISIMSRGDDSEVVRWKSYKADEKTRAEAIAAAWARHAELYAGLGGTSTPPTGETDADTVTLYNLGDPHIGMLSWAPETGDHFDVKIASRELIACIRLLVASAPPSRRAYIVNLGDFFHAQDDRQVTPGHGNKLDVDGRRAKVYDAGLVLLRGITDAALERHVEVEDRNIPGNHDPDDAPRIASWLRAVYENEPRVTVPDAYASYQYVRFGANLFGWHHGDGAKPDALPGIMANDCPEDWGATTERVWHCGHIHHLTRKEFAGCTVETHRTMAAKDAWHAAKGYRAGRSLQAITYHREFGEISRVTVNLARVRAALRKAA